MKKTFPKSLKVTPALDLSTANANPINETILDYSTPIS